MYTLLILFAYGEWETIVIGPEELSRIIEKFISDRNILKIEIQKPEGN